MFAECEHIDSPAEAFMENEERTVAKWSVNSLRTVVKFKVELNLCRLNCNLLRLICSFWSVKSCRVNFCVKFVSLVV